MTEQTRLVAARRLVEAVLAGTVTRITDPAIVDDDRLYFAVSVVERYDRAWLVAQLKAATNQSAKDELALVMSEDTRREAGLASPGARFLRT